MMSQPLLIVAEAYTLPLPAQFFNALISSPPFYQLRRYDVPTRFPAMSYTPWPGATPITIPAWAGELGWEPVPEWFVGHLILIAREARRTLRDDGTWWLNLGDSYWTDTRRRLARTIRPLATGEETGQLMGIPHRVMGALQADGWFVRNDVQWLKRDPRPEGQLKGRQWMVQADGTLKLKEGNWRHTRAHEMILQLTKRPNNYYADQTLIRMPPGPYFRAGGNTLTKAARNGTAKDGTGNSSLHQMSLSGANPRSYVHCTSDRYRGNHAAPFPRTLIRDLIQVSTPKYVCPVCQTPWAVVVQRVKHKAAIEQQTKGYRPTCPCYDHVTLPDDDGRAFVATHTPDLAPIPGRVGDIFAGSGTVPLEALALGYRSVASDLSFSYLAKDALGRLAAQQQMVLPLVGE